MLRHLGNLRRISQLPAGARYQHAVDYTKWVSMSSSSHLEEPSRQSRSQAAEDCTRSYSASQDESGKRSSPQPQISPAKHSWRTEEPQIVRSNASEPVSSSSAPRSSPHRSSAPRVATLQPSLSGQERDTANRQHARHSSHTWRNSSGVLQCPPWTHRQGAGSRQRAAQTFSCSMRGFAGAAEAEQQSAAAPAEKAFTPPGRIQNTPAAPWTPTQELRKRNFLPRRMGHLMQVLEEEAAEKAAKEKNYPNFEAGDLLELTLAIPENKGREAKVRGMCIAKRRRGYRTSFTLLNHVAGGGPVERSFPLYSPTLQGVKVLGSRRVRRAKLYYLRDRKPSEYKV
ncbi:hypothetical protein CVIRNUC_002604 [Coccomyxa viridis]|uniref:Ribosomal protein L19 n=1 Tax=Coccomyxa viridis TaxID=1274662 RepID=A0AAV1HXB7_9CHLO|nr:hypothetical protein CVIRNUC_002604 [Coccomyxa viridis]